MTSAGTSPAIASAGWGWIELDDGRRFKDAKLWPGGGREWDWRETGTGHSAGIQRADADELVEHGTEVVILSRGRVRALKVPDETVARLEAAGIEVEAHPTGRAVERYNELRESRPVGGLFHSTC